MRLILFFVFLGFGIACLLAALFQTRRAWRTDIPPFDRRSRPFQIALHPERFAISSRLGVIRALNVLGAASILCALVVVGLDIVWSMAGSP